ncbi:MAG: XRE family transcriptional regulator [Phycisphaerales bacterium]
MQTLGDLVRELRRGRDMTLLALAEAIGSTKSYLSMIENHRVANPPSDELLTLMERALGVTDGRLRRAGDWERAPAAVRDQFQRLAGDAARGRDLARFIQDAASKRRGGGRNLDGLYRSGQLRRMVDRTLGTDAVERIGKADKSPGMVSLHRVPLVNKVAAGYPSGFTDMDYPARVADDYVGCPGLDDPDAFAASVIGESMLPDYREGDIVVFSPAAEVSDGCDCFVRLEPDHETTFKRVFFDDGGASVRLQPLNPKFAASVHARECVAGLYRAVWRYAKI